MNNDKYTIFDNLLEGVQVVDTQGRYVYVNDAFLRQIKRSGEDLIGASMVAVHSGIVPSDFFAKFHDCLLLQQPADFSSQFSFPDGSNRYFKFRLQPVPDGVLIMSFDITDLRTAEYQLQIANQKLQQVLDDKTYESVQQKQFIEAQNDNFSTISNYHKAILDNTTDSIVLIGLNHEVLCLNNEIRKELFKYFHKYPKIGDDYRNFVVDATMDLYLASFDRAINGETILVENETISQGVAIWFQYKVNPVYREDGRILGIALTATNIDARKRKEIALWESERKIAEQTEKIISSERYYRLLIETSSDAIVLLDETGKVVYQNASTEKIIGYTLRDVQTIDTLDLIHPEDREQDNSNFIRFLASPDKRFNQRHRVRHKNGHYVWIDATYRNMLGDPDVKAIVLCYSDVSEKVAFEHKLQKANRELMVLNNINDIILRNNNEKELCSAVCECIVNAGGYRLAWICLTPFTGDQQQIITPLVAFGATAYLSEIQIALNDPDLSKGPTVTVLKTGEKVITNNVSASSRFLPWLESAKKHGIAASIVLPLVLMDGRIGALNIYSAETNAFDEHEATILERLASNLSLALRNISIQAERIRTKYLLRERVKELTTIYQVNKVLQNETRQVDEVLKAIVNLLPSGWQYPEICAARIDFDGLVCTSPDFQVTPYCQSADFKLVDGRSGQIQIVYIQERPQEFEGPFLKEERELINTIAENIRQYFDKIAQQAAVAESESYFRSSFEHAAIGKALTDLKGNFFRVNKAFCNLLGYSQSELQKLSFQQITHPDDLNESSDTVDMIIRGQVDYLRLEKRYIHSSGSVIWVNLNTAIVRDVNNNPLYFVSQMENITDRKLADVALAKSEANMRTIFNNTDVAYLLLDSHYNVIAFNLRFKNSFEAVTEAELKPNSYLFDVVPEDRRERMKGTFDSVMTSLQPVGYEYEYNYKGKRSYFYVSIIPVISGTEAIGVCMSATDITNRKKLELERQAIIDDLMQRNRDLQQFAHIVSHNVRGPLSTILGLVDLLQYDLSPEDVKLYISSIKITADKLDDVVRDLNKILQVRRELSEPKTIVKFNGIVSEITSGIAQLISDSNTTITTDFTQVDELLTVRSYLYAIFYNLINNSIKFCKPDVPPFIKIWTELHDGKIIICFRDNGIGIDMAHNREKIFMLYQRFNFDVEGKGLGLFMCKTQIEVLNGKIEVESQPGEGATFRLIFAITN